MYPTAVSASARLPRSENKTFKTPKKAMAKEIIAIAVWNSQPEIFMTLDVQVFNVLGLGMDKPFARRDFRAHQDIENFIGLFRVVNRDLLHDAAAWIHGCFPELIWVH